MRTAVTLSRKRIKSRPHYLRCLGRVASHSVLFRVFSLRLMIALYFDIFKLVLFAYASSLSYLCNLAKKEGLVLWISGQRYWADV